MEEREAGAERRRFKWVEQVADAGSSTLQLTRERGRWQWLLTRIQATHESSDRFDWPRFAERCRLLRSLREPYHLPVLEVGGTAGRLFVKMASIGGMACTTPAALDWLKQDHGLSRVEVALEVGWLVCGLIGRAQGLGPQQGNVWQPMELTPARVQVTPLGTIRVRGLEEPPLRAAERHVSITGVVWGNPSYMSPEQAQGLAAHAASQVFCVGLLMYEIATGHHPFRSPGDSTVRVLTQIVYHDLPPLRLAAEPAWHRDLAAIITRTLRKHPTDRFSDPGQLRRALASVRASAERQRGSGFDATARGDWLQTLELNGALSWLRERIDMGDISGVSALLDHRPDLAVERPVRDYIWNHMGASLLGGFGHNGVDLFTWRLLGHLPQALAALEALKLDPASVGGAQRMRLVEAMRWSASEG